MKKLFSKSTFDKKVLNSRILSLDMVSPVLEWIGNLDGVSQGWLLSGPIDLTPDHIVRFKIYGGEYSDKTQIIASGETLSYMVHPNDNLYVKINNQNKGFTSVNGAELELYPNYPVGNIESILEFLVTEACQIQSLMYNYKGDAFNPNGSAYASGAIYDFEVELDGVITHSIPLTNKEQGANQQPNIGNVSAFMPNFTEAIWIKKA